MLPGSSVPFLPTGSDNETHIPPQGSVAGNDFWSQRVDKSGVWWWNADPD